jgi:hypothetical protein
MRWLVLIAAAMSASPVQAGMPAPLPTNIERVLQLNEPALVRLQTISFFLLAFGICAAVVMLCWNYLQRDFTWLPRLSFAKAAAATMLWGLLFIIVLTMISGARELMTPGAWEKQGFTYKLTNQAEAASPVEVKR